MDLNDALQDFILESEELLSCMERALLAIRHSPRPAGMINAIFKAVRSLRTSAVLCKQSNIAIIAKVMENVLEQLRRSEVEVEDDQVCQLLSCCDIIKTLLKMPVALTPTVH